MKSRARVTLFGLAIVTAVSMPFVLSSYIGTNAYAAPEVAPLTKSDQQFVREQASIYCRSRPAEKAAPTYPSDPTALSVPVILYHRITSKDKPSHEVTRPELFREHMKWLSQEGYTTISVEQLSEYMRGNMVNMPAKPIVITFDDGWKDNVEASKVLEEFNLGATFYVISGFFDNKMYFDEEDVARLSKNPKFEIGSHTHSHFVNWESKLESLDLCTMATEAIASKEILERIIKKPVRSIAWPYGYNTPEAVFAAGKIGYTSTMMVNRDTFNRPGNSPFYTRRLNVDGTCPLSDFMLMVRLQKLKTCS